MKSIKPWRKRGEASGVWRGKRRRHWLNKWLQLVGCVDCRLAGIDYPWEGHVMHLDHDVRVDKLFSVKSTGNKSHIRKAGRPAIMELMAEVRKCTPRCANHHKMATKAGDHTTNLRYK